MVRGLGLSLALVMGADAVVPDPLGGWGTLIQYGVVGLMVVALLTGKLHSDGEFKSVCADRDLARADAAAARAETSAIRTKMEDQVVPAFVRMTDALARVEKAKRTRGA